MSLYNDRSFVAQSCAPRSLLTIRVVVADSTGASDEASVGPFPCVGGPNP